MNLQPELSDLIGLLVDGGLDDAGAEALLLALRADRAVAARLRAHLLIAEIAAQELVPERGFSAFAAGLYERQRAAADGPAFLARLQARLAGEQAVALQPDESMVAAQQVHGLSPAGWWWAAAAAAAIVVMAAQPQGAHTMSTGDATGSYATLGLTIPPGFANRQSLGNGDGMP